MGSMFGRKPGDRRRLVPAPATVISIIALFVALGSGAYAVKAKIGSNEIAKQAIKPKHFSKKAEDYIKSLVGQGAPGGTQGAPGADGPQGPAGAQGAAGEAQYVGENWGIIARNHIGSAVADLRSGPFGSFGNTGDDASPPFGEGSLGIAVSDSSLSNASPEEKASFGNEVDFLGDPVLGLDEVGFHVFQTGENTNPTFGGSPTNMPNITFEIDPNLSSTGSNFSSLVWIPPAAPATNQWSGYMDAATTGEWYLTGGGPSGVGTVTGCNQATTCTFDEVKTALDDGGDAPIIYTAAVTKGRDNPWVGAVDGFRINGTIHDFEPFGVTEVAAP